MIVLGGREYPGIPNAKGGLIRGSNSYPREVAAYDPVRDSWRTLARAPFEPAGVSAAVLGRTVYVLTPHELYAYDLDADAWRSRAGPPMEETRPTDRVFDIVAAGSTLFGWHPYPVAGRPADLVYDPAADSWDPVAPNPSGTTLNRTVVGLPDGRVVSVGVHQDDTGPRFYEAAVFDPAAGSWAEMPTSRFAYGGSGVWQSAAGRVVRLDPGLADASGSHPFGGELDVDARAWTPLPPRPPAVHRTATRGRPRPAAMSRCWRAGPCTSRPAGGGSCPRSPTSRRSLPSPPSRGPATPSWRGAAGRARARTSTASPPTAGSGLNSVQPAAAPRPGRSATATRSRRGRGRR